MHELRRSQRAVLAFPSMTVPRGGMRGLSLDAWRCQWQQRGRLAHCKDDPSGVLSQDFLLAKAPVLLAA